MTKIKIWDYVLPVHYVTAMAYADVSGLLDHEIAEIENFEKLLISQHGNANIMLGTESEESWFSPNNSVNNQGGEVCKVYVMDTKGGKE